MRGGLKPGSSGHLEGASSRSVHLCSGLSVSRPITTTGGLREPAEATKRAVQGWMREEDRACGIRYGVCDGSGRSGRGDDDSPVQRMSYNGSTSASQAENAGSIPVVRSLLR